MRYQTPPGIRDILPDDWQWYEFFEGAFKRLARSYDFKRIETPILEFEDLFARGIGKSTDIVEKEMYSLRTRGGDKLVLRPENTAPIVRAYLEHGMGTWPQPVKLFYFGPMFRYERQQAGRRRQFWQAGFEIMGEEDAVADAETILVTTLVLSELGLKNFSLHVNSIGCGVCRPAYRKTLVSYLRSRQKELCQNCRKRLKINPLRVLDCKEERCGRIIQGAPETVDSLCEDCSDHLKAVLEFLDELKLPYFLNTRLVRGLDYYLRTVFEVYPEEGETGAQSALAAGGRYDVLFRLLGGRTTGGVGVAMGVDRIIEELKKAGLKYPETPSVQVFLAKLGEQAKRKAPLLFEELRQAHFRVRSSFGRDSIKSQLRIADKIKATYVIILGQKEVSDATVILRSMATGKQEVVKRSELISLLRKRLREGS